MQFSLFDLLLLIGFTQGIITSVLLLTSKKNKLSNRLLGIALFAFCMITVKMLLHTLNLWETVSYLSYFPLGIELLLAPLLYFYCLTLITPNFQFQRKNWLHFLPFVISQSYAFFIYFNVVGMPTLEEKDVFANSFWFNPIKETEDHLAVISIFTYLVLVFNKLKSYKNWLNENISDTNYPSFNWIRNIFGLCGLLGVFLTVNLTLDFFFDLRHTYFGHWQSYFLFLSFLIYYLGIMAHRQPNFDLRKVEKTPPPKNQLDITAEETEEIKTRIQEALDQQKVFLNPTLNAQELANQIHTTKRKLSYVINHEMNKTFRDLINEYRVEEVKIKLKTQQDSHLSILGIALDCGFNSEASFYRIFKKITGLSPKEFVRVRGDFVEL